MLKNGKHGPILAVGKPIVKESEMNTTLQLYYLPWRPAAGKAELVPTIYV